MNDSAIDVGLLNTPLYSYSEADYLAAATRGTAKRWLSGYQYRKPGLERVALPPVTERSGREDEGVSFLDLVEVVAIGRLKEFGFSLPDIRLIVAGTQELLRIPRPLTTEVFKVDGREAFVEASGDLVKVFRNGRGQKAWETVLQPFLQTLDYSDKLARRWWPLGQQRLVCLDPTYAFGLPVISGSGVRTEVVFERWETEETREEIAADFNISIDEVDSALRFEVNRAMKRAA